MFYFKIKKWFMLNEAIVGDHLTNYDMTPVTFSLSINLPAINSQFIEK